MVWIVSGNGHLAMDSGLSFATRGFFENPVDLDNQSGQYQQRRNRNASETIYLVFVEYIGVFAFSARHQEHAQRNYQHTNQHPLVIIAGKKSRTLIFSHD